MANPTCPSCEKGKLLPTAVAGRTMKHRNLFEVPIPADFEIPTCDQCGAEVVNFRLAQKLDGVLEEQWQSELARRAAIDIGRLQQSRPLREWERVLGLSVGYLSKLRGGKSPGAPLTALIALLANNPKRVSELESLWGWPGGFSEAMLQHHTVRNSALSMPPPKAVREVREVFTMQGHASKQKVAA